jgi:RNA polymerase sigma-70 factor, ECF subfamily
MLGHRTELSNARILGSAPIGLALPLVGKPRKLRQEESDMNTTFSNDIVETLPHLRAYARMVARDRVLADDLVQETVLRALVHSDQFRPGTNLKAWLKTILRNSYINEKRSEKRQAQYAAGFAGETAAVRGDQEGHVELNDCARAFATLSAPQRQALALVGASGLSYEEAAQQAGCGIGTMKSRTFRARLQLRRLLDGEDRARRDQELAGYGWAEEYTERQAA